MRKMASLAIIGIALLLMGFSGRLPAPGEGIYSCKLKTLTLFDLMNSKELPIYFNIAELTDSKPDNIELEDIDVQPFSDLRFGSFRTGNNEQKIWFLMAKSTTDYWDEFYIDQNRDNKIIKKEKIKNFQTGQRKERGSDILEAFCYIPVPLKVSFKGVTREYEQTLYFFISTISYSNKKGTDVVARVINGSFFEGEMKVNTGKNLKLVKFRIVDSNSNACYNDFGKDLIYMDLNQDGYFRKNESQALTEFFDSTGDEKMKKQLRMNILPFSMKFGVTEVTADFDLSQLEPALLPENETKTDQAKKLPESPNKDKEDLINSI